ncbi:MAG TPA: hypothetical protein GXX19_01995 [Syntrophomonadaceae bacterium]|nr:hypothetical protein [Syntrophomonadaceae bacterium]
MSIEQQTPMPTVMDILPVNMEAEINKAKQARVALDKLFKELLVPGVDCDRVPGTDKPTLLKAGAELLAQVFHLSQGKPEMISCQEDFQNGVFSYTIGVPIYHRETGILLCYGIGAANSKEPKYRYRKSKEDDGVKFENPDPAGEQNTLVKMAMKRAFVDGVLKATGASRMFTQDVEDFMPPELASTKQKNYIRMLFKGVTEEDMLAEISEIIGHDLANLDELLREEASKVIEAKKGNNNHQNGNGQAQTETPRPKGKNSDEINWTNFWASVKNLGYDENEAHNIAAEVFGTLVLSMKDVLKTQADANKFLGILAKRRNEQTEQTA